MTISRVFIIDLINIIVCTKFDIHWRETIYQYSAALNPKNKSRNLKIPNVLSVLKWSTDVPYGHLFDQSFHRFWPTSISGNYVPDLRSDFRSLLLNSDGLPLPGRRETPSPDLIRLIMRQTWDKHSSDNFVNFFGTLTPHSYKIWTLVLRLTDENIVNTHSLT